MAAAEPSISLPLMPLVGMVVALTGANLVAWSVAPGALGYEADVSKGGMIGATVAGVGALAGAVGTVRWIPKPASTALMAWLAGSVLTMIATLGAAFVLYSRASAPEGLGLSRAGGMALLLAVVIAFVMNLFGDVALTARHLKRLRMI
jgi:hypothetical protein